MSHRPKQLWCWVNRCSLLRQRAETGLRNPREGYFYYLHRRDQRKRHKGRAAFEMGFPPQGLEQGAKCPGEEGNWDAEKGEMKAGGWGWGCGRAPRLGKEKPFPVARTGRPEDQEEIRRHCGVFKLATFEPHWPRCFLFGQHGNHIFQN